MRNADGLGENSASVGSDVFNQSASARDRQRSSLGADFSYGYSRETLSHRLS